MKKFLTVLLVIAVMFTFSFGSAFATTNAEANLIKQADAYAKAQLPEAVEKAIAVIIKAGTNDYITEEAWEAATADIIDMLEEELELITDGYLADASTISDTKWDDYDLAYAVNALYGKKGFDYITIAKDCFTPNGSKYAVAAAKEQFKMDMEDILEMYGKVDLDALYSKTTPTADNSYYVQAEKALKANEEAIKEVFFDAKGDVQNAGSTVSDIASRAADVEYFAEVGVTNAWSLLTLKAVKAEYYDSTSVVKYYYVDGITTKSAEEVQTAVDAAKSASIKAQVAANVAKFLQTNTDSADKTFAANYAEVYNFLADYAPNASNLASAVTAHNTIMEVVQTSHGAAIQTKIDLIDDLEALAAKYAAEKDENGVLVRDAALVTKAVAKATAYEYATTLGVTDAKIVEYSAATAENYIKGLYTDLAAEKLAFDKEAKKADLADKLDGLVDDYYDLEYAAVKAEYEKAYAAIDAADDADDFDSIVNALNKAVDKILEDSEVEALFSSVSAMDKELEKQAKALVAYVTYQNAPIVGLTYEDAYVLGAVDVAAAEELLVDYYIENNARTAAEMKALTGAVEAVAATLPTTAELEAAAKAAKDAVKALPAPTKIKAADKDAVVAAFDLIDAYVELSEIAGDSTPDMTGMDISDEIAALFEEIQDEFDLAYAKADKTDKAALKAIKADIKAANKELYAADGTKIFAPVADGGTGKLVDVTTAALEKIQNAEKAAVEKAINAIPINVTQADVEAVKAARELYDAYVAEYTNIYNTTTGFVADDFAYTDLVRAEAALGLNAPEEVDAAYSVEGLKITASSKATKGAITVKWTVEGDTDAVEGYEIWKSTKKNSGFKKAFTATKMSYKNTKDLKKGTRYFYKVRAIAYTAEGEKVKSDWSNKAYRVAK